jgi:hypothetical protein
MERRPSGKQGDQLENERLSEEPAPEGLATWGRPPSLPVQTGKPAGLVSGMIFNNCSKEHFILALPVVSASG